MARKKLSKRGSKKNFSKGAGTQSLNLQAVPMRGGFRI